MLSPSVAFAQRVAAYDNSTLVVTPDGKVWSFGWNVDGQLGHDALPRTFQTRFRA